MGLGGFEPPTSPLSGVRSNQLSYRPNQRQNLIFQNKPNGGAMRDRTADLLRARQALSQLSYSPNRLCFIYFIDNLCGHPVITYQSILLGGDPATGSPTATLLRLHPSHESLRGDRLPEG